MRTPVILLMLLLSLLSYSQLFAKDKENNKARVLLVFSSGEPFAKMGGGIKGPGDLDAITSPTPVEKNTGIAARRIRASLERQGITVRLARVEDFSKEDWQEVHSYDTIIIGSPARFWTMSWETKRFLEMVFFRIYFTEKRAEGKMFALFSTAEIIPSAKKAIEDMSGTISDNRGNLALKLPLSNDMSEEDFNSKIDEFSKALSILIR